MNRIQLKAMLVRHEGLKLKPYRCTAGKLTIGVGRNIEDRGISNEEAGLLLENDINEIEAALRRALPWFGDLSPTRQSVLIDMGFMGVGRLLEFKRTLSALAAGDWQGAAEEMLQSKWALQVGQRANELADLMRAG